jgi:hypothetical protein
VFDVASYSIKDLKNFTGHYTVPKSEILCLPFFKPRRKLRKYLFFFSETSLHYRCPRSLLTRASDFLKHSLYEMQPRLMFFNLTPTDRLMNKLTT